MLIFKTFRSSFKNKVKEIIVAPNPTKAIPSQSTGMLSKPLFLNKYS